MLAKKCSLFRDFLLKTNTKQNSVLIVYVLLKLMCKSKDIGDGVPL